MGRLEAETNGVGGEIIRRVPKSRGPTSKPGYMSAPFVDAYGFRGQDPRVLFLCPFEFFMYWEVKRVPEPFRQKCSGWSAWTKEGEEYYNERKHNDNFKLVPGKHYKVTAKFVAARHEHVDARVFEHGCARID